MASRKRTIKGSARQGTLTRRQAKTAVRAASGKAHTEYLRVGRFLGLLDRTDARQVGPFGALYGHVANPEVRKARVIAEDGVPGLVVAGGLEIGVAYHQSESKLEPSSKGERLTTNSGPTIST